MDEQAITKRLLGEGYDKVYTWKAEPGESDPGHKHPFDTKLIILAGNISIEVDSHTTILEKGNALKIPREKIHAAKVGSEGCKYIVAEKH